MVEPPHNKPEAQKSARENTIFIIGLFYFRKDVQA